MLKRRSHWIRTVSVALALIAGTALLYRPTTASEQMLFSASSARVLELEITPSNTIFLPVVARNFPLKTVFGVGMDRMLPSTGLDQVEQAQASWIRRSPVLWSEVEPVEGAPNWTVLAGLEAELIDAANRGIEVVLVIHSTPDWAQQVPLYRCGRIREDKLEAFAAFVRELVQRYSGPPYRVRNWEIWNEPDVSPNQVPQPDYTFGCWGDENDPYFGGGYYAEMLKIVYPEVKQADPGSRVIVGGLLLDCNPDDPPEGKTAEDCKPSRYLEGILRNDGAAFFDGVSFHAYDYYVDQLGQYNNGNWHSSWNSTGPVTIAKADFLTEVLTTFDASGKFLINTESALLCNPDSGITCDETFQTTKVHYLPQAYVVAIAEGLEANLWYSLLGWRNSELLDSELNPRPAYYAFQFARTQMHDAKFVQEISSYPGLRVYELDRGDRLIWVVWSLDGGDHEVVLPSLPSAVYDSFGAAVPVANPLTVSFADGPLYLEWP